MLLNSIMMKASEWTIIVMFSLLLALWLFRSPKLITGWGDLFGATKFTGTGKVTVKDASASMLVVFITFALPVSYSKSLILLQTLYKRG